MITRIRNTEKRKKKMKDLFSQEEDGYFSSADVVFRDMISLLLLGFVLMFFILIVFINTGKKEKENLSEVKSPGSLVVHLVWDHDTDVDLDLWGKPPDDFPIGFSNRENSSCNLLRDDLGKTNDLFNENFENIYCRNLIPGEYIFNIHFYGLKDKSQEINYKVEVSIIAPTPKGTRMSKVVKYIKDHFLASEKGVERTLIRFKINEEGLIDDSSINNEFVSLLNQRN